MLKAQSKAYYGIKNIGHFGLGLNHYTHLHHQLEGIQIY